MGAIALKKLSIIPLTLTLVVASSSLSSVTVSLVADTDASSLNVHGVYDFIQRYQQCRRCVQNAAAHINIDDNHSHNRNHKQRVWCQHGGTGDMSGTCSMDGCDANQKTITNINDCPNDAPATKPSCTLCTLDAYTWCSSGSRGEYDGYCIDASLPDVKCGIKHHTVSSIYQCTRRSTFGGGDGGGRRRHDHDHGWYHRHQQHQHQHERQRQQPDPSESPPIRDDQYIDGEYRRSGDHLHHRYNSHDSDALSRASAHGEAHKGYDDHSTYDSAIDASWMIAPLVFAVFLTCMVCVCGRHGGPAMARELLTNTRRSAATRTKKDKANSNGTIAAPASVSASSSSSSSAVARSDTTSPLLSSLPLVIAVPVTAAIPTALATPMVVPETRTA